MTTHEIEDCIAYKKRLKKLMKNNEKMIKKLKNENSKAKKLMKDKCK